MLDDTIWFTKVSVAKPSGIDQGKEAITCSSSKRIELTERVPALEVVIEGGDEPSTSVMRLKSLSGVLIMGDAAKGPA